MDGERPGGISRGSVVFERLVPVDDLRPGDVITFRPPASAHVDGMVTHRIVTIDDTGIVTQGDALAEPDPWRLQPDGKVVPRVVLSLPWVGYAYLLLGDPVLWLLLLGGAGLLAVLLAAGAARSRRPAGTPVGAGAGVQR
jgi:signal peptidase